MRRPNTTAESSETCVGCAGELEPGQDDPCLTSMKDDFSSQAYQVCGLLLCWSSHTV